MATLVGIDLGGTHVMAAIVDGERIGARAEREIVDHAFDVVIKQIADAVQEVRKSAQGGLDAIGIGSPGNIDLRSGTIRYSPNFGWENAPLGSTLHEQFGVPVFVGNDARCATLAEYAYGTGRSTTDFVLLTLGTGIGGGIIADGSLVLGVAGGAGEFGHHQVRATDGFICGCGKIGCFEAQASGTGLLRHALATAPSFPRSALLEPRKPEKPVGSKQIRRAAAGGDPHAVAAWTRYVDDLARGLANVIAFVSPQVIALGGGLSSAGDFLLDAVRPRVDALTTMVPRGGTRLVVAELGNDAGAIGAALMARRGALTTKDPA